RKAARSPPSPCPPPPAHANAAPRSPPAPGRARGGAGGSPCRAAPGLRRSCACPTERGPGSRAARPRRAHRAAPACPPAPLAGAVESALAAGTVSRGTDVQGSRADICFQVTNALFDVVGIAGVFGARPGYVDPNCTVPAPVPPSGNTTATYIKSEVAAFRVG